MCVGGGRGGVYVWLSSMQIRGEAKIFDLVQANVSESREICNICQGMGRCISP